MTLVKRVRFSEEKKYPKLTRKREDAKTARVADMFPCHLGVRDITHVFFGDSIYLNYECVYIVSVNELKTIYQNYYNVLNVKKDIRDGFNLKIYA